MFHKHDEYDYVLLCSGEDLRYRIGLRQFAHETIDIARKIPDGYTAYDSERENLDKIALRLFGI